MGDWRLPNRNELLSLINFETFDPALPAGLSFSHFPVAKYWSSTTFAEKGEGSGKLAGRM
jgi:Protein of unknown function (DUF1566)